MGRGSGRDDAPARQRLDKWIWFARFLRTREGCAALIRANHVRVNARRETSPGAFIKVGDVLTLALGHGTFVLEIRDLGERRSNAEAAELLYFLIEGPK